jgi:hypothetical protein
MGRHQTGCIFESAPGAFHVRYYTTEIVDGQTRRVQKSHFLLPQRQQVFLRDLQRRQAQAGTSSCGRSTSPRRTKRT